MTDIDAIEIVASQFAVEFLFGEELLAAIIGDNVIDSDNERPIEELARRVTVGKNAMEYRIQRIDNRLLANASISGQERLCPL